MVVAERMIPMLVPGFKVTPVGELFITFTRNESDATNVFNVKMFPVMAVDKGSTMAVPDLQ